MIKKISFVIFSILNFFDKILKTLINRSFIIWFKDFIEESSYRELKFKDGSGKLIFFTPNFLSDWLVRDFYKKEPETLEWIKNFKEEDNKIIFWDIGANIGLYSIYAAKTHENIEVISFEPSTNNLRILTRNIFINKLNKKIKIFQLPLGNDSNKFANFSESIFIEGASHNSFNYNLNFEGKSFLANNEYQIFGTSIASILEQGILNLPDYIKIDVDGIEHLILTGAGKYLKEKKIKSIQIEVNENYKQQFNSIIDFMKENKFSLNYKKRNENLPIYKDSKFSKTYNYFFEKKT